MTTFMTDLSKDSFLLLVTNLINRNKIKGRKMAKKRKRIYMY